jgi:hypothetical protein
MDRYAFPTAGLVADGGNERLGLSSAPASEFASERKYAQRSAADEDAVAKKRAGATEHSPTESGKRGTSRGRKEKGRKRKDGSLGSS